ncbi:GNAT family N-acetyltransferase [Acidithiobacillus sp. AMEEHan]|uniref:GNAT family N-acetyltransferase n=1 Tax=Acidithiobacillus sp. AMEEHan TaxID=2994951 RepID=UPI0027E3E8AC|nr:GNAT family N-acetyltransferase [Acidithiobacillus sp. AMEEHan]
MQNLRFAEVNYDSDVDKRHLLTLLNEYATLPIGQGKPIAEDRLSSLWENLGRRRLWVHAFLGYIDVEAVAMAITIEGFSTFQGEPLLNIHDFFVSEPWQGRAVGTTFLTHVIEYAKNSGFGKITLEVLSENVRAKHLYRRLGFSPYSNPIGGSAEFWQKWLGK